VCNWVKLNNFTKEDTMVDFQSRDDISKGTQSPKYIAQHTLTADKTLSYLALKYYGHATPPYWQLIYEAKKAEIGDDPNKDRPGLVLKIPTLPDKLK
jgi:nucleoid-associated protein YgaU